MPLACPLCNRVNPDEALYCCRDGAALGDGTRAGGPIAVGAQPFTNPFVFPAGRFCRSFDELVLACEEHWQEARDLLTEGMLESFLSGLGRADLSWAARRCAAQADPDLGLDELLAQLPGDVREPSRLAVQPAEINLGRVSRGADHRLVIHLLNEGMGLLRGAVAAAGPEWLALGEDGSAPDKVFQFRHDQEITVRVVGRRLRAGFQPQEGRLVVESNGGSVVIVVRVEAPTVAPFPQGVLAGAETPRRLAEMTRAAPREAAVFFENGAVKEWYETNGWTYPVQGPPAAGVAALQQFYEALGLAAAPRVELERPHIHLEGPPGAALEGAVVLQTSERRPVFAHATSAEPWLKIDRAVLAGRTARIPVRVPQTPDRPGEQLRGRVQVTANGNQRFTVEVVLTVTAAATVLEQTRPTRAEVRKGRPAARPWRGPAAPREASPAPRPARRPGLLAWLLAGGFLLLAAAVLAVVVAVVVLSPDASAPPAPPVTQTPAPPTKPDASDPKPPNIPPKDPPPTPVPPPPPPAPDAAEIAKSLTGMDADERIAALRKLAALGPKASPALHDILKAMKDQDADADFRREALAALPKIGSPTAADAEALGALAADAAFPEGRTYALDALAALGPDARPAALNLCGALKDGGSAQTRRKAAEILGTIGAAVRDMARGDLIDALKDPDATVGAAALAAVVKMGPVTTADEPKLLLSLSEKAEAARRFGLTGFRDLGADAAEFAPRVEDSIVRDASPELRRLAVAALLAMAPNERRSADAFTKALSDAGAEVRRAAVAALVKVGPDHGAMPGLIQALGSDDEAESKAAEDALKAARLDKKQIENLGEALRKGDASLRLKVLALLKPLGADAEPAVPAVSALLQDGPGETRKQAFALLAAMGPAAKKAGGALAGLLNDDKFAVRLDAATTLAAIEGGEAEEAIPVLIDGLRPENLDDPEQTAERDRAIEALGRMGEPAVKPLTDALEKDFAGGKGPMESRLNTAARLAAVKALAALGPAANSFKPLAVLTNLQKDPSLAVREAAKEARAAIRKNGN